LSKNTSDSIERAGLKPRPHLTRHERYNLLILSDAKDVRDVGIS